MSCVPKIGQRDLRRLLVIGMACVVRVAIRRGAEQTKRLAQMLARKPRKLVTVALAHIPLIHVAGK